MSNVTAVPIPPVRRNHLVWLVVGIVAALIAGAALAWAAPGDPVESFLSRNAHEAGVKETASGLQYKAIEPGSGPTPTDTDVALVTYEGRLLDGTVFDKSQAPAAFGVAQVVPGFSEGLKLMSKGAKYRFWIKPSLGYGEKASGPIPANSVLDFDVELLDFLPENVVRQMQAQQQARGAIGAPGAPGVPLPGR